MSSVTLSIGSSDAEKIAACIKSIAGGVSASDIVEIVLKTPAPAEEEKKNQAVTMTSKEVAAVPVGSGFLLEGKPRSEYEEYCNMFNQFITGPAVEGREIAELTERYKKFYDVMKAARLRAKESNELEDALYGVAIEAEMQGFIYGFKMFDALLNRQLEVAV